MTVQSAPGLSVPALADEPAWLAGLRAEWWSRVEANPWPTGSEEEWRRTSLDALSWAAADAAEAPRTTHELPAHLAEAGVVFVATAQVALHQLRLVAGHIGQIGRAHV